MGVCPCEHMQQTLDGCALMEHGKFPRLLDHTARLSTKVLYPCLGFDASLAILKACGLGQRSWGLRRWNTHFLMTSWSHCFWIQLCLRQSYRGNQILSPTDSASGMGSRGYSSSFSLPFQQNLSPALCQEGRDNSTRIACVLTQEMNCRYFFPRATQDSTSKGGQRTVAGSLGHQRLSGPRVIWKRGLNGLTGLGWLDVK